MDLFKKYNATFLDDEGEAKTKPFWQWSLFDKLEENLRLHIANLTSQPKVEESEVFQCGRCGGRKIRFIKRQMRSADEPETVNYTCLECGNNWRDG